MEKLIIVTDSNSGITQDEGKKLGIFVVPMPFTIEGEEYFEDISISQEKFYEFLKNDVDVKTSQPSQNYLENLWNDLLNDYEEIVYIPMSSGLSATCRNAMNYAEKYDGKVQVVDNQRISISQKSSVLEAIELKNQGKSAIEIKDFLEKTKSKASIYLVVSTLKYLRKGGRVTPTAAKLGDMLKLKPILSTRGKSFDKYAICLTFAQAKKKMLKTLKAELETEFKQDYEQGKMLISIAHSNIEEEAQKFKKEIEEEFPNLKCAFVDPLSLSVSCHTGPGALGVGIFANEFYNKK